MTFSTLFSKSIIYYSWFIVSTIALVASYYIEPYLFAYTVLGSIGISIALFLVSLFFGWRRVLLALTGIIPSAIGYTIMTSINWA